MLNDLKLILATITKITGIFLQTGLTDGPPSRWEEDLPREPSFLSVIMLSPFLFAVHTGSVSVEDKCVFCKSELSLNVQHLLGFLFLYLIVTYSSA